MDKGIHYDEPTTDVARTEVAAVCNLKLDLQMPMLIDWIDNDVDENYVPTPIRLYLVDITGRPDAESYCVKWSACRDIKPSARRIARVAHAVSALLRRGSGL